MSLNYADAGREFRNAIEACMHDKESVSQKTRLAILRDICTPISITLRPLEDSVSSPLFAQLLRATGNPLDSSLKCKEILSEAAAVYRDEILISLRMFLDGFIGKSTTTDATEEPPHEAPILRIEKLGLWLGAHIPVSTVVVYGVVSRLKSHKGHTWLELKDAETGHSIQCVIWKSWQESIGTPKLETDVRALGRFNFWPYRFTLCLQITGFEEL